MKERLKQQEVMAQAEAGAQAVTGSGPTAQGSGPSEVAAPSVGGAEPGSTSTAEATVEATAAEASTRDAGQADVDEVMVEVPREARQEAAQPEVLQPRQDPSVEPATTVKGGAVVPLPVVLEEEVPATEGSAPAEGSTPTMVDLTLNDSPIDKGKQVVGVEEVEAVDQAGPSVAVDGAGAAGQAGPSAGPESALAGPPSGWPDLATLALVRAEEEIPRWGIIP
jgi:hypothetical protein